MIKILFITKYCSLTIGGVPNYIYNTVISLNECKAVLLCKKNSDSEETNRIDDKLREKGHKVIRNAPIPEELGVYSCIDHPVKIVKFIAYILQLIKNEKINLIVFGHSSFYYLYSAQILKIFTRKKIAVIFQGEDIPVIKMRSNSLMRFMVSKIDILIANSNFTKNRLIEFMGGLKKEVIIAYPGVEDKYFEISDVSSYYKDKYGLWNRKIIYTLGRLDKRKGHDVVMRCLKEIVKQVPDVKYLIGGKGESEQNIRRLVNEYNLDEYVCFVGFVPEEKVVGFYQAGDIFVMPNRTLEDGDTEGFGIVFLEAAAAGKPVLGGMAGGVVDAIEDGVTGFLVNPYNDDDFIDKVVYLLKTPEKAISMGKAGSKRAKEIFRWEYLVEKLENSLLEYLKNSSTKT